MYFTDSYDFCVPDLRSCRDYHVVNSKAGGTRVEGIVALRVAAINLFAAQIGGANTVSGVDADMSNSGGTTCSNDPGRAHTGRWLFEDSACEIPKAGPKSVSPFARSFLEWNLVPMF